MAWLYPLTDAHLEHDLPWATSSEAILCDLIDTLQRHAHDHIAANAAAAFEVPFPPTVIASRSVCRLIRETDPDHRSDGSPAIPPLWHAASFLAPVTPWLRSRIRRCRPRPLPPTGSLVVVLDVDALIELHAAVVPSGRRSRARLRNLTVLAWQRGAIQLQMGLHRDPDLLSPSQWRLLEDIHDRWLRGHPRRGPLARWLGELRHPSNRRDDSARPRPVPPFDLRPAGQDHAVWGPMARQLRKADINVYKVQGDPPQSGKEIRGPLDPRLAKLLPGREYLRWATGDWLGLYVSPHGKTPSSLPPGVHLFCDRIRETAQRHDELTEEVLAWFVLWHELTHWHLDAQGAPRTNLVRLAPIDIEEVYCEVMAHRALERGRSRSYLPELDGPSMPKQARLLARWRVKNEVFPYSWYPRMLLPANTVDDARFLDFTLAAAATLQECEDAWSGQVGSPAHEMEGRARVLSRSLRGTMPIGGQRRVMSCMAMEQTRTPRETRTPVCYLWRRGPCRNELISCSGHLTTCASCVPPTVVSRGRTNA